MNSNVVYMKKLHFTARSGHYTRFLTAYQLMGLLGVSKATAYKMIEKQRVSSVQRELLELKCFGLIPGWNGWRIEAGRIIDPTGYVYTIGEIQCIPLWKSINKKY